ncbi:MAG: ABC transporter substrate-binding protein [Caldilineaceae bacterium]|nr:ABC transporter substrate-binding protein [Caldilineaceae bacterium]
MRKYSWLLSILLALSVLVAACAGAAPADTGGGEAMAEEEPAAEEEAASGPQYGGTLRLLLSETSPTYYSWEVSIAFDAVDANTMTKLVPSTGEIVGDLAESWDISDDGLTYTFRIHQNVRWHDGEALTAEDIAWSYNTVTDPAAQSIWGQKLSDIVGFEAYQAGEIDTLEGVQVVDDHTLQITLQRPNAFFPSVLPDVSIWPKHILGDVPRGELRNHQFWVDQRIGSGPFKYAREVPGEFVEFTRNDDYFKGKPFIETVLMVRGSRDAHITALEAGEVDGPMGEMSPQEVEHLNAMPHLFAGGAGGVSLPMFMAIKQTKPELNLQFRQAVAHAIDRDAILEEIFKEQVMMIDSFIPGGPYMKPNLEHWNYDPELSRQLLEEGGWDPERELYIFYYYQQAWAHEMMTAIQAYLADVGIKSRIRYGDWSVDEQDWYLTDTADIEMGAQSLFGSPDNFIQVSGCEYEYPAGWNGTHYCNERFDELFQMAKTTTDEGARTDAYYEAQDILNEDLPFVWLFSKPAGIVYNNRVHIESDGLYIWRRQFEKDIHLWWIEE